MFLDNGGKALEVLLVTGLTQSPGRGGADAFDDDGVEYEVKTVDLQKKESGGISTARQMTQDRIDHYRTVVWIIALYEGIELKEMYRLSASDLEPWLAEQEEKLKTTSYLNNPHIPLKIVLEKGKRVFQASKTPDSAFQTELLAALRDKHAELLESQ